MLTPTPRARRFRSMITTPQPEATDAGVEVLAAGGNAVDAAIAAAMVQGVVDPLMCGIGGMADMQIVTPDGTRHIIDGLGTSPAGVRPDMWEADLLGPTTDGFGYRVAGFVNETGAQSVMTPGTLRAFGRLHARFGSLPWADLFAAAIRLAREGWLVRPHTYTVLTQNERRYGRMNMGEKLAITPDGRRIYLGEGGSFPSVGDTIINPELADTLIHLRDHGAEALYTGELATAVADSVAADGGFLTAADLADYELHEPAPLSASYRGLTVSAAPAPAGGVQLLQTLGIMDRFDLSALEHNSPEHIRILAEAMKTSLRDKERLWNEADASPEDFAALLTADSLDAAARAVRSGEKADVDAARPQVSSHESRHTTHLCAADESGLTISLTHTLGNPSGYIPAGTGFVLNGGMSTFDPRPGHVNSIQPGKRRNTTMAPVVVMSGDEPVVAIGAPGASWITPAVAQGISNILDFGMSAQEAVMAPRVVATSNAIDISNRIPRRVQTAVEDMGYEVRRSALSYAFAGVHALTRFEGTLAGGADPQRDGYASGV